jgi:hypothetical protein
MTVPWPLQPASYNGVPFYVEVGSRASGRRIGARQVISCFKPEDRHIFLSMARAAVTYLNECAAKANR